MKENVTTFLPLAPATLSILLALAGVELHGYGIMQEVSRQSEGQYRIGPGVLYDNLQRLLDQQLVREVDRSNDSRRRYYRLTALGRKVLTAEIARLESVIRDGRARLRIPKPGRA